MSKLSNTGAFRKVFRVAIGVLFLALELRNGLVIRYTAIHHIVMPILWLYPILTCIPVAIYWKAAVLTRKHDVNDEDLLEKMFFYLSTGLVICLILFLLGDSLLSDVYMKIGCSPK
jgi:hypothetical protein